MVPYAVGAESPSWVLASPKTQTPKGDFGADRPPRKETPDKGRRWHTGVDLGAPRGAPVFATEPGTIVGWSGWDGPQTAALFVETDTGLLLVYGALEPDSWAQLGLTRGSRVGQGQQLATVGVYPGGGTMLHFETWSAGSKRTRWFQSDPPPPGIRDPRQYLALARITGPVVVPDVIPAPQPAPSPAPRPAPAPAPPSDAGGGAGVVLAGLVLMYSLFAGEDDEDP